jgi:probable HAF family extracellular repeat protein
MKKLLTTVIAVLALQTATPAALANPYVFTVINPSGQPVAGQTSQVYSGVFGLNDNGQLIVESNQGSLIYQNGVYSPLPPCTNCAPGDTLSALGINDSGAIVGTATDVSGNSQGFVLQNGTYSLFALGGTEPSPRAVSPSGIVTGVCSCVNNFTNTAGFTYDPSTGTSSVINVPNSLMTFVQGMNSSGQIAGSTFLANGSEDGFVYQNGGFSTFQVDGTPTEARGINNAGLITGFVNFSTVSTTSIDAFVGTQSNGYQLLSAPGALATFGEAINNSGQIAGDFYDANYNTFGFLATPVTLPSGIAANGAFTFNVPVSAGSTIYIDPAIASGYQYQIGNGDPNFQSVTLPIGIGDNQYSLSLCGGTSLGTIAGGTTYSFGSAGTDCFDVTGIPLSAGLSPNDSQAFPTGLTFMSSGTFDGTMTAMTSTVPEPGMFWLFFSGLIGIVFAKKTRETLSARARATAGSDVDRASESQRHN